MPVQMQAQAQGSQSLHLHRQEDPRTSHKRRPAPRFDAFSDTKQNSNKEKTHSHTQQAQQGIRNYISRFSRSLIRDPITKWLKSAGALYSFMESSFFSLTNRVAELVRSEEPSTIQETNFEKSSKGVLETAFTEEKPRSRQNSDVEVTSSFGAHVFSEETRVSRGILSVAEGFFRPYFDAASSEPVYTPPYSDYNSTCWLMSLANQTCYLA
ncbi:MAG: hypothetical protein S4CHLAM6_06360 [Chlamydiae bacterium]|nr:hypothetical protein [Chlamydiota bacterium]